jgi:membrane-associated protease RseP (regulator of RpoE activity)
MKCAFIWIGVACFSLSYFVTAQQPPQYFTPIAASGQILRGRAGANEGAIGIMAEKSAEGFTVTSVVTNSPAETSGIKKNDILTKINGKNASDLSQIEYFTELKRNPGEKVQFLVSRAGQQIPIEVTTQARSSVYPQESNSPSGISQTIFGGHTVITASVGQDEPHRIYLWLFVSNGANSRNLTLDDSKFFVLDGSRRQLHHVTLNEITYSLQTSIAQNMRAGSYTPPPPPRESRQYTITGAENGNYTINSLGTGNATVTGTSTSSYTVTPQPDYSQLGYSLGVAFRQMRDRKHDKKLVEQAQQTFNQLNAAYLKTDSPIIPGENRTGGIIYWNEQGAKGPFRVVLFLTDPIAQKDQTVTFDFQ